MLSARKYVDLRRLLGLGASLSLLIVVSLIVYWYSPVIIMLLGGVPGVLGFFLLSFISCLSIIPIPYTIIVFRVARYVNPVLTSVVVGAGSTLGEVIAWNVGKIAAHLIRDSVYMKRATTLLNFINRRGSFVIPLLAFIFSLTFLPDKLLYLPLGMIRYSLWKVVPFTFLGKSFMMFLILILGRLWGVYVEDYIGEEISFAITTLTLIIITILIIYIDWEKVLRKYI